MRATVFRGLLTILEKHTPDRIAAIEIQILMSATERAFGRRGPAVWFRTPRRARSLYAAFTTSCLHDSGVRSRDSRPQADSRMQAVKREALRREARKLGSAIRRVTGFRKKKDLTRLIFYLYKTIGIRMSGELPGDITVSRCFFSHCYTPRDCAVMSLMDEGVIAGICGGGRLVFSERLTEGCGRCRACFTQMSSHCGR